MNVWSTRGALFGCVFAIGCGGAAAAPTHAAPAEPAVTVALPVVTATASAAPTASAVPSVGAAKIELRSVSQVRAGGSFTLTLVNVGSQAFRFEHPGASNGCGAFRWAVSAVDAKGQALGDSSQRLDRMCTMAIVSPRTIVIEPGATVDIAVDTERGFMPQRSLTSDGPATRLPPGEYTFFVNGAGLALSAAVTITKG